MAIQWTAINADNILGYLLDQSGIGEGPRKALRRKPEKQVLKPEHGSKAFQPR